MIAHERYLACNILKNDGSFMAENQLNLHNFGLYFKSNRWQSAEKKPAYAESNWQDEVAFLNHSQLFTASFYPIKQEQDKMQPNSHKSDFL